MSGDHETLENKLKKAIETSGFPLELEIGSVLKENHWSVQHSPFYFNIEDLTYKEYDIKATQYGNNIETRLYIECKHSNDKQWVFFAPDALGFIGIQDLRFFPIKPDFYRLPIPFAYLKDTLFRPLSWFCDGSRISLNNAIFSGDKKVDSRDINNSINTSMKALISDNLLIYDQVPKIPELIKPQLNLSIVVFEGKMFLYSPSGTRFNLEKTEYIKYRHEMRFDAWKYAEHIRRAPIINRIQKFEHDIGSNQIVEIIHRALFPQYLKELIAGIEALNKIPIPTFIKETAKWFKTEYLISQVKKSAA